MRTALSFVAIGLLIFIVLLIAHVVTVCAIEWIRRRMDEVSR